MKVDRLRYSLGSQVTGQFCKLVIAVGIGGWMARYLGPAAFGKLSYVTALVGLLGPFGSLGVRSSLSALLCETNPLPGLVSSAMCVQIFGALIISILALPLIWLTADPVVFQLTGLMICSNIFNASEVFEAQLLHLHRGVMVAKVDLIKAILGAILSILALIMKAPLLVFGALVSVQSVIRFGLLLWSCRVQSLCSIFFDARWQTAKTLMMRGFPLFLSGMSIMLYTKSDQIMLEYLKGSAEVGHYSVAVRVAETLYFMPVVLANTFNSRLGDRNRQTSAFALRQLYQIAWLLGGIMVVVSSSILPLLINLVFGNQYLQSQAILVWLAPAAFGVALGCASGAWLNMNGCTNVILYRTLFGAVVNIGLNLFLIPAHGAVGAAMATSISYACVPLSGLIIPSLRSNTLFLLAPISKSFEK